MSSLAPLTVVVGAGVSGLACVRYLRRKSQPVVLVDTRVEPPGAARLAQDFPGLQTYFGALPPEVFQRAERIVLSPGLAIDSLPEVRAAETRGVPVIGEMALFAEAVNVPVAAITGTNGKSTATVMAGHVLRELGMRVGVGGNLGTPALDLLELDADAHVLELSSFQLERAGDFVADVGTVPNVAADHLDRYASLEEYAATKRRIYAGTRCAVYNRRDARTRPEIAAQMVSFGNDEPRDASEWGLRRAAGSLWLCRGEEHLLDASRLPVRGAHNYENALAALIIAERMGADPRAAAECLVGCEGLPHRCEMVGQIAGVDAINDSKATNPGACIAALEGLDPDGQGNIVLIAGGRGKGFDYACLREPVAEHVRSVVLIGEEADALEATLQDVVEVRRAHDLCAAAGVAFALARSGDCVLLSPACASFDQFENFEARGDSFRRAVQCLTR